MAQSLIQHALLKLNEECCEVAQMCSKTSQFGMDECMSGQTLTNRERLHAELNDLNAMVELLNEEFGLRYVSDPSAIRMKKMKVQKYLAYSQDLGLVER